MAKIVKVKSGSIYEEKESYSRLVAVDDWIFVSNTAGRNYRTREIASDAVGQIRQALENVRGALESVGSSMEDVVNTRVFIPHVEDAAAVMAVVGEVFRGIDPARTVTCSPLGNEDFLAEIEVTAHRGAGSGDVERVEISL